MAKSTVYAVTVRDSFFRMELCGEFEAASQKDAELQARQYYAEELDSVPEEIEIVGIKRVG